MNDINTQEQSSKWTKCLEMALYYKPRDVEEQIKIATVLYESEILYECDKVLYTTEQKRKMLEEMLDKLGDNKNKTILQKALDKIKG